MTNKNSILILLNIEDLSIINNSLNEVCHGFRVNDFDKKIGVSKSYACELLDKIHHICKNLGKNEYFEDIVKFEDITIKDLIVIKNAIHEVFREIDDWEFDSRVGVLREEAKQFVEKITKIIDTHSK